MILFDHQMMNRAVQLANRGRYTTHPNPRVGCVIAYGEQIVGEGWHQRAGKPHAEVYALRQATEKAKGATAYVTLEPCSHFGKTPPCADALITAGISRLVVAMQDPNPLVAGKGLQRLSAAGIEVEVGLLQSEAEALNPGFIKRMQQNRPFVRLKLAMSLDGRTAMASGESQWITGSDSRADVHRLRARSDAILTGIGTVLADDPSLNVRLSPSDLEGLEGINVPQPLRVVLDSYLSISPQAKMFGLAGKTLLIGHTSTAEKRATLIQEGVDVEIIGQQQGRVNLNEVMSLLAQREINELLIEAGPTLAGAALQAGIVDEIVLYMAPHVMGSEARGLFNLPGLDKMADRIDLKISEIRQVGEDVRLTFSLT
ncbi:MAG: bifunctional diaminohydroxyphosphoribosylaminopyrimidine deaminase/5-amino-6-(5-phosphoribosylamino)uracil reductase RibD [Gammaproteobacteria bacterium]|nr:bifunctional diaminohydroxyphosphoribosylaminopyrimidine deaminase/5-amino-6-(5-phosphoribosylamino)uracil reductase RibD [Gammaproteobacteria bacterium]